MSNAAAATADAAPTSAPKGKSKKMLIIIIVAAVLVLALGGVGAMLLLKKKPAEAEGDEEAATDKPATTAAVKHDPKTVPTFVPLDPFVVNLADKEADRFAQIGMTLEVGDAKLSDQIKTFMPAIRHAVLMVLAEKTAAQLIDRAGKEQLARQVQREVSRVLGAEIEEAKTEDAEPSPAAKKDGKVPKKKKKAPAAALPIGAVHFSSFIVQ